MCSFPKRCLSRYFHGWLRSLFRTQHKCHLLGEDFSVPLLQIHPASILFAVLFSSEHSALPETILLFDYLPPLSVGSGSIYLTATSPALRTGPMQHGTPFVGCVKTEAGVSSPGESTEEGEMNSNWGNAHHFQGLMLKSGSQRGKVCQVGKSQGFQTEGLLQHRDMEAREGVCLRSWHGPFGSRIPLTGLSKEKT